MAWVNQDRRRFDLVAAVVVTTMATVLVLAAPTESDAGWPEAAAGIGAFFLILLRRWRPLVLLGVALVATAGYFSVYERPSQLLFAALVLLATVCVRMERWPAIGFGAAFAASLYVLGIVATDVEFGDERAVIGIAWTWVAVGVADAARSWRRYRASAEAEVRAAVLAAEAQARQSVTEERLTIARELHDLLAHNLSVMNVQTGTALHLLHTNPDQAEQSLLVAREAGRSVLDELRELLGVLRDRAAGSEPTSSLPTFEQIPALVETMRSAGLDVTWSRVGTRIELSPAVSLAAYRIVQEALTNAAKHGDGRAELETSWDTNGLFIRLLNGIGAEATPPPTSGPGGHGLVGMRERALTNGGRFEQAAAEGRFQIEAWLPRSSAPAASEAS